MDKYASHQRFALFAKRSIAFSAKRFHGELVEVIDPTQELTGPALRDVIVYLIEYGRVNMPEHAGLRMEERNITGGEILTALRRGVLRTDSCVAGKWRYLARKSDVEVCFTFDIDDDGNLLVLVTVIRRD